MWQRIKTALVLVTMVGIALFASKTSILFVALLGVGVTIAAYEWSNLMPQWRLPARFVLLVLVIAMLTLLLPATWVAWWIASLVIWINALIWVAKYPHNTEWYGYRLAIVGLVILTAAICAMYFLWQQSPWWLMYVFMLVWCADSGAYFVGRKFGHRKMSPHVSPNKSMEGLAGGLVIGLAVVIAISLFKLRLSGMPLLTFVVISGITILASVLGDLFESMLKRQKGVKDSGTILPGHGGVLDRIDSILAATPIFALGFWIFKNMGLLVVTVPAIS